MHKTFLGTTFDLRIMKSWSDIDEELRQEAEEFINEIGGERLVSVTERTERDNRFVIVVWYWSEELTAPN
jgi:hypothetical protein